MTTEQQTRPVGARARTLAQIEDDVLAEAQVRFVAHPSVAALAMVADDEYTRGCVRITLADVLERLDPTGRVADPTSVAMPPAPRPQPSLKRLDAVAREQGFPSTPSFSKWCERRGVTVHRDAGKLRWVDLYEVEAAKRSDGVKVVASPARQPRRNRDAQEIALGLSQVGRKR